MSKKRVGVLALLVLAGALVWFIKFADSPVRARRPDRPVADAGVEYPDRPRRDDSAPARVPTPDPAPAEPHTTDSATVRRTVTGREIASGTPNLAGVYSAIVKDAGQPAGYPILNGVAVNVNTARGGITIAVGQIMDAGSSSSSGTHTLMYNPPDGEAVRTNATTSAGANTGVAVNETNGTATGIANDLNVARQMASGDWSAEGGYRLKFKWNGCKYTIKVAVDFPKGGRAATVTVSDGS